MCIIDKIAVLSLVLVLILIPVRAASCKTPNNEEAECKSLYLCPTLLKGLLTQDPKAIEFVKISYCGNFTNQPQVCCGSSYNYTESASRIKRICGYQHSDDYYRILHSNTSLDEYPWLALLKYTRDSDLAEDKNDPDFLEFGCSGSLISKYYVLTAAHCLKLRSSSATGVRFGEYNVQEMIDCDKSDFIEVCADPVQDYDIKAKIKHPKYNRRYGLNDIALLRLATAVVFTDFIRPICLPTPDRHLAQSGDDIQLSGFGKLSNNGLFRGIKKKVLGKLISNTECAGYYNNSVGMQRTVTENVLCASELSTNVVHFCAGDSGGPLMFSNNKQWHLEGVAAWSATECSGQFPIVLTKVSNYLSWIDQIVEY